MRSLLCVLILAALPATALGQENPVRAGDDDCAKARKAGRACNIVIEPEDLRGIVPRDQGEIVQVRKPAKHPSLIRLRTEFRREIVNATDRL